MDNKQIIDKANENINKLINMIVSDKRATYIHQGYCPTPNVLSEYCEEGKCRLCKKKYFKQMEQDMKEQYMLAEE